MKQRVWFNPLSDSPVRLVTRRETRRYMRPAVRDTACKHGYVVCGECQQKLARAVEEENARSISECNGTTQTEPEHQPTFTAEDGIPEGWRESCGDNGLPIYTREDGRFRILRTSPTHPGWPSRWVVGTPSGEDGVTYAPSVSFQETLAGAIAAIEEWECAQRSPQPETRVIGGVTWERIPEDQRYYCGNEKHAGEGDEEKNWTRAQWHMEDRDWLCTPCLDREAAAEQPDWRAKARAMGWRQVGRGAVVCNSLSCFTSDDPGRVEWQEDERGEGRCDACMRAEVERASQPEPELPEGWNWTAHMDGTHATRSDGAGSILKNEKGWRGGIPYKISDHFSTARAAAEWVDAQLGKGK